MSADNEVTAAKSAGISPMALVWPAIGLSFFLSAVAVWLNDVAFSWGQAGVQRVVLQSVEEIAYGMLRTQRSFANPRFSIVVKGVEGRTLIRPTMNFQPNNDMPAITLTAVSAELRSNLERGTLILVLNDAEMDMGDGVRSVLPGIEEYEIPLKYASAREVKEDSPTQLPLKLIDGEMAAQAERIEALEQALAADLGLALLTGDLHTLGEQSWKPRRRALADARTRLFKLQTEPYRRWASGFSCLCFVLVGVPLAILWRRADVMSTFAVCFIPILLIYYPLLAFGLDRAKAGALPPYTVWAANLLLVAIGFFLLRRVIRY
jgi:lipopolysaccharide export system permease protein